MKWTKGEQYFWARIGKGTYSYRLCRFTRRSANRVFRSVWIFSTPNRTGTRCAGPSWRQGKECSDLVYWKSIRLYNLERGRFYESVAPASCHWCKVRVGK